MAESYPENRSQRPLEAYLVALLFVALAVGMVFLGSRGWLPDLASRHGLGIDRMLIYLLVTTGAMFLIGHLVLAYFIWRYSRLGKVSHRLATAKMERGWSLALGVLMTLVAEGGVLAIGMPVWGEYFASEAPADALVIEITSEQFAWNIRYSGPDGVFGRTAPALISTANPIGLDPEDGASSDDITTLNQIYVPVDRPVRIQLRSKDVIHSFFLAELRVKQDAVPGMKIDIWFVPTRTGQFELACTELCGLGHYRMEGFFNVLSAEEYDQWLTDRTS